MNRVEEMREIENQIKAKADEYAREGRNTTVAEILALVDRLIYLFKA